LVTLDGATTVTAQFNPTQVSLAVTFHGLGNQTASIVSTPAGISCSGTTCTSTARFDMNSTVSLDVTQAVGAKLAWSNGCTGNPCAIRLNAATSLNVTTPGTAVPFSVAFQTTSRVPVKPAAAPMRSGSGGNFIARGVIGALVLIAAIALFGNFAMPKRLVPIACAIALAIGVAATLDGCKAYKSGQGTTGTPVGTYKMTVQATAQSAPRGVTVTLDVQ